MLDNFLEHYNKVQVCTITTTSSSAVCYYTKAFVSATYPKENL